MGSARDWHRWHREYDDPASSLSRRLGVVREQVDHVLTHQQERRARRIRLVSLCAGDGRDVLPVLASRRQQHVSALLVELDAGLAGAARRSALGLGLDNVSVRSGDAANTDSFADFCPADVLMLCGVFGNIADGDVQRTIDHLPALLTPAACVIWTRGRRTDHRDVSRAGDDPSVWVRDRFLSAGFEELAFVRPADAGFRVGVNTLVTVPTAYKRARLFTFTDAH